MAYPLILWAVAIGWSLGGSIAWAIRSWPAHESLENAYLTCMNCKKGIHLGCCNAGGRQDLIFTILSASLAGISVGLWGLGTKALLAWVFSISCVIITVVDIRHLIIPDILSINGFYTGLIYAAITNVLVYIGLPAPEHLITFSDSLLGFLAGGGILWGLGFMAWIILKKEGMGGGDVKLLAAFGAWLGLKAVLGILIIGSLFGSIGGIFGILYQRIRYRKAYKPLTHLIPFGPYLCIGFLIVFFAGMSPIFYFLNLYQQFLEHQILGTP